jgi:hypothetical protein
MSSLQEKNPSLAAKFPDSFGYGPDAYITKIDVFHQIHCLNKLRRSLQPNYGYGGDMIPDKLYNLHL